VKLLKKSILLGTALLITIASPQAFDFQMQGEEPDQESEQPAEKKTATKKVAAKKKAKRKGKAGKSKGVKKAKLIKRTAKKKATQIAARAPMRSVQEQIRLLNEKMDRLESGQHPAITPASALPDENAHDKSGFISVPGTNTIIKIGGYVKADGIYDANQFTGDSSNLPTLRLKGLDADANRTNVFTGHAKQTRISLGSETTTANGQVLVYFEGDFFGSSNEGTTGNFTRGDNSSLNSYNFRIRHAYGSYCFNSDHRVDIGQMWTLFYDPRSGGTTIEFNGPETTAQIRRPQIRYTKFHQNWKFGVSLESGATEYLDVSPAFVGTPAGLTAGSGSPSSSYNASQYRRAQSSFLGGITGDGNQGLPDLVAQLYYKKKNRYHFSLGAMGRELSIKKVTSTGANDPIFAKKKYGYGIALGGRFFVHQKSNIFSQFNFGKGIGTYIFGLDGYGAAVDVSRGLMQTQFCYGFLFGAEHYWSDKWRTNIIYSQARANVSSIIPGGRTAVMGVDPNNGNALTAITNTGYSVSNLLRQFYINLLWAPVEKFEIGLEYAYFRRDTINRYYGFGNRFQFGAFYKF
jgi:hypothetical protein